MLRIDTEGDLSSLFPYVGRHCTLPSCCYAFCERGRDGDDVLRYHSLYNRWIVNTGLSGSFSAFQMAAFVTQLISPTKIWPRGLVYTLLEASLFFGKVIGPSSSGFYAQYFGFKVPLMFIITSCCVAWHGAAW